MAFGPTGKKGEKWPFLTICGPIFPFFGHFFSPFSSEAKIHFSAIFPHDAPEARDGACAGQPGLQQYHHVLVLAGAKAFRIESHGSHPPPR